MTSEIAIMNRRAVVLAADSAVTASAWVDGKQETRYFKGANKIFNCSEYHPVGLMTFGNADLQGVPWELIIRAFRSELADKSFNQVRDYANDLFEFIRRNIDVLPPENRDAYFLEKVKEVAVLNIYSIIKLKEYQEANDDAVRKAIASAWIAEERARVAQEDFFSVLNRDDLDSAWSSHEHAVSDTVARLLDGFGVGVLVDHKQIALLATEELLKRIKTYMPMTGIVVAGFGDKDFFPALIEYRCYGAFLGKVLFDEKDSRTISTDDSSEVIGFASTAMVDTFINGANVETFKYVSKHSRNL